MAEKEKSVAAEIGDSGLRQYTGYVKEEFLRELQGQRGAKFYHEMASNHPVIGAMLLLINALVENVDWSVDPASADPIEVEKADFVKECMDDMQMTWKDIVKEALTYVVFGWSVQEVCYGPRDGKELEIDGEKTGWRSRYDDNKIGWRKISLRSQDSLQRWEFNKFGDPVAMVQQPPSGGLRIIPLQKCLHLKATALKANPEGKSMLRNAVVPYILSKNIQNIEAIGIERDLAGVPVAHVPSKIMLDTATPAEKQVYNSIRDMVSKLRRNESSSIVLPSDCDQHGNKYYDLNLLTSGGSRQIDITAVINRYDLRIAMTLLADFILLGQTNVGSFALASEKTNIFATALGGVLNTFVSGFNRQVIPQLLELNGYDTSMTPIIKHGDLESISLTDVVNYVTGLSAAGMPLFPDPALEDYLRKLGKFPKAGLDSARDAGDGSGEEGDVAGSDTTTDEPSNTDGEDAAQQELVAQAQKAIKAKMIGGKKDKKPKKVC